MKRIGTASLAILLALLVAAPSARAASCNGASHQLTLSNGTVAPASGTTATPVTFSVLYADTGDCAPTAATLTVDGVGTFPLNPSGSTWASGVTLFTTVTLPPGTHTYSFAASSGDGGGARSIALTAVSPAAVAIVAPAPAPTQAPTPVPPPAPTPRPRPTPAPIVTPAPTPVPTAPPTPPPTPAATAVVETPVPEPTAAGPVATAGIVMLTIDGTPPPTPAPEPVAVEPLDASGWVVPGAFISYLLMTAAGLGFFFVLMRRRRDTDPEPAPVTAAVATAPATTSPAEGRVTPLPPMRELVPPVDPDLLRDETVDSAPADEAGMPRWLRPSVQAARGREWRR